MLLEDGSLPDLLFEASEVMGDAFDFDMELVLILLYDALNVVLILSKLL